MLYLLMEKLYKVVSDQPSFIGKSIGDWVQLLTKLSGEYCLLRIEVRVFKLETTSSLFLKFNNMKLRKLKKKYPSKLERMWIEHYLVWKSLKWLNKDYQSIRLYYIESCKKHIRL
jgi:hypothetical protein